jgi:hypothetical protein
VNLIPGFVVQEVEPTHLSSVSIAGCVEIMLAWPQSAGMCLDEDERLRSDAEVERFLRSVAPRS